MLELHAMVQKTSPEPLEISAQGADLLGEIAQITALISQKLLGLPQEDLELIVMDPMPSLVNLHQFVIADDRRAPVDFGILGPALPSPEQQCRAGDPGQHFF